MMFERKRIWVYLRREVRRRRNRTMNKVAKYLGEKFVAALTAMAVAYGLAVLSFWASFGFAGMSPWQALVISLVLAFVTVLALAALLYLFWIGSQRRDNQAACREAIDRARKKVLNRLKVETLSGRELMDLFASELHEELNIALNGNITGVAFFDATQSRLTLSGGYGNSPKLQTAHISIVPDAPSCLAGHVFVNNKVGHAAFINGKWDNPCYKELEKFPGHKAVLGCPCIDRVVTIYGKVPTTFSMVDKEQFSDHLQDSVEVIVKVWKL